MPVVYLVVPCYNEEAVLPETVKRLTVKLYKMIKSGKVSKESRMLFVDDGSKDRTWEIIEGFSKENRLVGGVKLSRNRGHQNALLAGLMTAKEYCDCAISLDADLQDDIEVLDQFVEKYNEGCEIVYGVRSSRDLGILIIFLMIIKHIVAVGGVKIIEVIGDPDAHLAVLIRNSLVQRDVSGG